LQSSDGPCEPLCVRRLGKILGFWSGADRSRVAMLKWCSPYCQTPSKRAFCNLYVLSATRIIGEISAVSFRCFGYSGDETGKFPSSQDGRLGSLIGRAVVFEQGRRPPRRTAGSARIIWVGTAWASAVGISLGGLLLSSRLLLCLRGLPTGGPFPLPYPSLPLSGSPAAVVCDSGPFLPDNVSDTGRSTILIIAVVARHRGSHLWPNTGTRSPARMGAPTG
jgi:hypothetical protein